REDLDRTRNREGLPIEVLDSLRLLDRSRNAYLDAILAYNRAQFELYVALGQPPANVLARPIPTSLVPAPPPLPCPPPQPH
ncbi:MAG TPA: TolC family protein, partial [Gemmataceae bacterium]|nr:TolC family protein [Gemmataceae bacterium]